MPTVNFIFGDCISYDLICYDCLPLPSNKNINTENTKIPYSSIFWELQPPKKLENAWEVKDRTTLAQTTAAQFSDQN